MLGGRGGGVGVKVGGKCESNLQVRRDEKGMGRCTRGAIARWGERRDGEQTETLGEVDGGGRLWRVTQSIAGPITSNDSSELAPRRLSPGSPKPSTDTVELPDIPLREILSPS